MKITNQANAYTDDCSLISDSRTPLSRAASTQLIVQDEVKLEHVCSLHASILKSHLYRKILHTLLKEKSRHQPNQKTIDLHSV